MREVPYRLQQLIYPLIKDTVCYYCIFIRGFLVGGVVGGTVSAMITGVILWAVFST